MNLLLYWKNLSNEGRLGFKSGGHGFYDLSEREMLDRTVGLNEYLYRSDQ